MVNDESIPQYIADVARWLLDNDPDPDPLRFDVECADCSASLKNATVDEVTRFGAIHYRITMERSAAAVSSRSEP